MKYKREEVKNPRKEASTINSHRSNCEGHLNRFWGNAGQINRETALSYKADVEVA